MGRWHAGLERMTRWLVAGLLIGGAAAQAFAEDEDPYTVQEKIADTKDLYRSVTHYDPDRVANNFPETDANGDGVWSLDEAKAASDDAWWTGRRFTHADANGDGTLSLDEVQTERQWEYEHADQFDDWVKKNAHEEMQQRWNDATPAERAQFAANHPRVAERLGGADWKAREGTSTTASGDTVKAQQHKLVLDDGRVVERKRGVVTDAEGHVIKKGRERHGSTADGDRYQERERVITTESGNTIHVQQQRGVTDEGTLKERKRVVVTDAEGNVVKKGKEHHTVDAEGNAIQGRVGTYTTDAGNTVHVQQQRKVLDDGRVVERKRGVVTDAEGRVIKKGRERHVVSGDGAMIQQRQRQNASGHMQKQTRKRR